MCLKYVKSMPSRMPCFSKSLFWFGGIGASLIIAYGSIYLFYANNDEDYDDDDDHNKNDKLKCSRNDKDENINYSSLKSLTDNGSDSMSDDSSIEIILLYKRIPNTIFEQSDCFKQIQDQTGTIIEENIDEHSFNNHEQKSKKLPQFRNISIQGYHKNVMKASRRIDQLVSPLMSIECKRFEILSSKLPLITGINGSTIKSLAARSEAKIVIDQSVSDGPKSQFISVDIYGTREQINMAYNLIDELLNQERQFHRRKSMSDQIEILSTDDQDELDSFVTFDSPNDSIIIGDNHPEYIQKQTKDSLPLLLPYRRTSLTIEQISYITESFDVVDDPDRSVMLSILPPIQVYVSHINDPGLFYVQINESKRSVRLDELIDDMKTFYSNNENQSACSCDSGSLKKNDVVAVKVGEKFYRGYIIECLGTKTFKVFHADFGNIAEHSISSLYYLNGDFLTRLPFQAIRCSLSDIDHISRDKWTTKEIEEFRELTREGLWEPVISIRCNNYRQDQDGHRIFLVEMFSKLPHQSMMTINVGRKLLQLHNQLK